MQRAEWKQTLRLVVCGAALMMCSPDEGVGSIGAPVVRHERSIPILGVTWAEKGPIGVVTTVDLRFEERSDQSGLMVQFQRGGKFSPKAQTSVEQAIHRAAKAARLSTDSWTVRLTIPSDVKLYGDSLSAMIGLTVIAFAKDDSIKEDRIITGGIAPDGSISKVGGLALKIAAARDANIRQVLVPDEWNPDEGDWQTPFLMQVSPVASIQQAYMALTGSPLN